MSCDTGLPADWRPSPNFEPRRKGLKPDLLLLHYTAMDCGSKAVDWLCNPEAGVSCHYLVDEDGSITQMVSEAQRAWHAGVSSWCGETDINSCSIGIEIQNVGYVEGVPTPYPDVQIDAVMKLSLDIIKRNSISPVRVLGHSDVAFGRKIDPGEAFPWDVLHRFGVGHWVEAEPIADDKGVGIGDEGEEVRAVQSLLLHYGYGIDVTGVYDQKTASAINAFQAHWRQKSVDGIADRSTVLTLEKLSAKIPDN